MKKFLYIQIAVSIIVSAVFFFIWKKTDNVFTAASATLAVAAAITATAFVASKFASAAFATFATSAAFAAVVAAAAAFTVFTAATSVFIIAVTAVVATILVVATAAVVVELSKENGKHARFSLVLAAVLFQFVMEYGIINGARFGLTRRVVIPVVAIWALANAFRVLPLIQAARRRRLEEEELELVEMLPELHHAKTRKVAEERLAEVRTRLAKIKKQNA